MNVINLSKNAIRELKYLPLSQHTINTEATIYKMKYQNQDKILKSLYFLNGERFANKLYTIEMLNYYKDILPTSFCIPDNIVTQDNRIYVTIYRRKEFSRYIKGATRKLSR